MAGHSKWANIKHKKERADAQKGKIFSRVSKEIISAVKVGGADPKSNARLRLAIEKAKAANVPNENIERNIKKAANVDQTDYTSITYEIYGHGGVGMLVEMMTDNKNRAASDIRIAINKRGGSIGSPGSVAFNFDRKGVIQVASNEENEEVLFQATIEAGAEDFEAVEEGYMITTDPADLYIVKEKLEEKGIVTVGVDIEMIPKTLVVCDEETQRSNLALIEWLEDLDDVNNVYHNMDTNS
ncbi:MAG: YebC/PmpR family DNA-binding transcriptional regulator [Chlamydiia bacterium]|nr:YebC/PmpR family DNA-binding transcriptional regulator [Chlamydiia bacterium]